MSRVLFSVRFESSAKVGLETSEGSKSPNSSECLEGVVVWC